MPTTSPGSSNEHWPIDAASRISYFVSQSNRSTFNLRAALMELSDALAQISEIRQHICRTEVFRGCRWLTVGFSGVLGFLAATIQACYVAQPQQQLTQYLMLWVGAAALSVVVVGAEIFFRTR